MSYRCIRQDGFKTLPGQTIPGLGFFRILGYGSAMTTTPFLPGGVIFDMDGLMLDTERLIINAWIDAARGRGWPVDEAVVLKTVGIDEPSSRALLSGIFGPDFPYYEIQEELSGRIIRQAELHGIPHRPGLLTLLDHLAKLELPLAVATSASQKTARWKLSRSGILERFSVLACGDEVRRGKPAPDVFLLAAERLDKNPAECVGFEDSPAGLLSLRAAGIRSVFIKDLVEPPPDVLASVWRRCGDMAEAAAFFG
ncbi:MAG: HAD family phosphatase [Treponema sp.]|jgi:HAD superfamily hydrolase (TIGR01509 family)|nr:HAD family phosphatase [Treponema sp.]